MAVFTTYAFIRLLLVIHGKHTENCWYRQLHVQLHNAIGNGFANVLEMRCIAP